jgi:hypothetical protein
MGGPVNGERDLFAWADGAGDAKAARDDGMAAVSRADFMTRYLMFVRTLASGSLVTGEDVSLACASVGIVPHHHNAWGAAANQAVRLGLLIDTGQRRHMQKRVSHARQTPVYRVR